MYDSVVLHIFMASSQAKKTILMFPWLAHGHISPFLELAKKLTQKNFTIFLISTPINLKPIRENQEFMNSFSNSIHLLDLHLPPLQDLPPHLHTTKILPPHLMSTLKTSLDLSKSEFSSILKILKPNLVIFDFVQPWTKDVVKEQGIEAVLFMTYGTLACSFFVHFLDNPKMEFPFQEITNFRDSEILNLMQFMNDSANGMTDRERFLESLKESSNFVLMKTSREIEGKYLDHLSLSLQKEILHVGHLVQIQNHESNNEVDVMVMDWLCKKEPSSIVYVSFGSEYFLGKEEMEEIAYGLEQSKVGFIWVVRFYEDDQRGVTGTTIHEALPAGFLERTGEKGMVLEGWAPQAKILSHGSVGGFVSHCGFSSTLEGMVFGVPIVAMPMQLDQPLNAKLVVENGVGIEVPKKEGKFKREDIARVIQEVVCAKEGEEVRVRAKDFGKKMKGGRGEEMDVVAKKLLELIKD